MPVVVYVNYSGTVEFEAMWKVEEGPTGTAKWRLDDHADGVS
jgi:hypothetical protein